MAYLAHALLLRPLIAAGGGTGPTPGPGAGPGAGPGVGPGAPFMLAGGPPLTLPGLLRMCGGM
jgi:hypothetical protein